MATRADMTDDEYFDYALNQLEHWKRVFADLKKARATRGDNETTVRLRSEDTVDEFLAKRA